MGIQFRDADAPRYNGGRPLKPEELPHGLVQAPQEILDLVADEAAHTPLMDEAYRKRLTDAYTLEYYYEGMDVAYRRMPQGIEVFAVGLEEVGAYVRATPPEQRLGVVFGQG
jgi:hypothetical protein